MSKADTTTDVLRSPDTDRPLAGAALLNRRTTLKLAVAQAGGWRNVAEEIGWDETIRVARLLGELNHLVIRAQVERIEREQRHEAEQQARREQSWASDPLHDERVIAASRLSDAEFYAVVEQVTAEYQASQPKPARGLLPVPVTLSPFLRLKPGEQIHHVTDEWWAQFPDHGETEQAPSSPQAPVMPMPAVIPADPYSASPARIVPGVNPSRVPRPGSAPAAPDVGSGFPQPAAAGSRRVPLSCQHTGQTSRYCGQCGDRIDASSGAINQGETTTPEGTGNANL